MGRGEYSTFHVFLPFIDNERVASMLLLRVLLIWILDNTYL